VDEVVSTTPVLANIDIDLDLEVIVLVGNTLTACEEDGGEIWNVAVERFFLFNSGSFIRPDNEERVNTSVLDDGIKW
jgi:hypothetical protein